MSDGDSPLVDAFAPVAVTERSGFDESLHHGAVVVFGADGSVACSVGDPDVAIYPRSANKPMQADAMLALGVELDDEQLALACASHDGTERHVSTVRRILAGAGLGEDSLGNTPSLPLREETAEHVLATGGHRSAVLMNCSGKHAAMVATCRLRGWPTDSYLDVDHPLQIAITAHIADLAGPIVHIGVDGCGAPAHALTLRDLAIGFRRLASSQGRVWHAMSQHPELVGGEERTATRLMRAVPGAMAKDGAEGVFALALPDGRAVALKIADGQQRPVATVLRSVLRHVGIELGDGVPDDPVLGHGRAVGTVRALI